MVMAVVLPSVGRYTTAGGDLLSANKDILPWGQLAGILPSPNNLGQFLAIGSMTGSLPSQQTSQATWASCVQLRPPWTASRSSMASAGAGLLTYLAICVSRTPRVRRGVAVVALIATASVAVLVPLTTTDPAAFSGAGGHLDRGTQGMERPADHREWLGMVLRRRSASASVGPYAFHAHNELVQLAAIGGMVLLFLVLLVLGRATASALRQVPHPLPWGVPFLVSLVASGTLEVGLPITDRALFIPVVTVPLLTLLYSATVEVSASSASSRPPKARSMRRYHAPGRGPDSRS